MIKCENGRVQIKGHAIENVAELELIFFQLYSIISEVDKEHNNNHADRMYQNLIERFKNVLDIYKNQNDKEFMDIYHEYLVEEALNSINKLFDD